MEQLNAPLSGGTLVTNFKLTEFCSRDVLDLVDILQELGYSFTNHSDSQQGTRKERRDHQ